MPPLRPVVLSGGSGTRLWPLSTPDVPKQFSPLIGDRSLFGLTLERLAGLPGTRPGVVVTGSDHLSLVEAGVETSSVGVETILVEPVGRNTAPASIAAAMVAQPGDVLVILPSDHLIGDVAGFREAIGVATGLATDGGIVTFGIKPTRPETGFGYIEVGDRHGAGFGVVSFKEKPGEGEAAELVQDGRHLWNSGIFVARADRLIEEARMLCPDLVEGVRHALPREVGRVVRIGDAFASVESISFDYAIMEKTERGLVVPLDVGWSDVGSYRSLLEVSERDERGNHIEGEVALTDVTGSYIKATSRPVVVAGVTDIVVVETPAGVLVLPIDRAQDVKDLQARVDG